MPGEVSRSNVGPSNQFDGPKIYLGPEMWFHKDGGKP